MSKLRQALFILLFLILGGVPSIGGEVESNLGRHFGFMEFLKDNCSRWVETDQGRFEVFEGKVKAARAGSAATEFEKSYKNAVLASKALLTNANENRMRLNCRATTQLLKREIAEETPFGLKK